MDVREIHPRGGTTVGVIHCCSRWNLAATDAEVATEFGLEPDQLGRLNAHFNRLLAQSKDAYVSDIAEEERDAVLDQIRIWCVQPAFSKWYDLITAGVPRDSAFGRFLNHVHEIRTSMQAT
jgi:hypothetical protein